MTGCLVCQAMRSKDIDSPVKNTSHMMESLRVALAASEVAYENFHNAKDAAEIEDLLAKAISVLNSAYEKFHEGLQE